MGDQKPSVDQETCIRAADQICEYYADTLAAHEKCRSDPKWHEMQRVAQAWRSLLVMEAPNESEYASLASSVLAIHDQCEAATTWHCLSTNIDIWLRSRGRPGLGIWHGNESKFPRTVITLW